MIEDYLKKFARLRTDAGRNRYPASTFYRAPHKPLLLLSVMDHIAEGVIAENFIRPSLDLAETFNAYISLVLPAGWKTSMAYPFPRLQRDGFWHRISNPGYEPDKDYNVTSIAKLQAIYAGAKLDDDLFLLLINPESRLKLRTVLIATYFVNEIRPILLEQSKVNLEAYNYSQMLLTELKDNIQKWDKPESLKVRAQGFRKTIVHLYGHRCAMCGIRMITPEGHTIVEAAHIKPWALSHDDLPANGLALCRLCHWSFDEGLMSVGRDYEVLVSKQAKKDPNIPGPIMTFADRPIFRPNDNVYWPSQNNFAWHRDAVFK
jgi:putative restriction endonuclease